MERIDKIIASSKNISRSDARALIKKGLVSVDGEVIKAVDRKVDEASSDILCGGESIGYSRFVYIMMNKPKGVISASEGKGYKTVIDILPDEMKRKKLFPAGRLDKDTMGFMLITDDGDFAHRILSPKSHIPKTYVATLDKPFGEEIIDAFNQGIILKDDTCMPALLEAVDDSFTVGRVTIRQGMYHQIKRMFGKFGIEVVELRRIKMGSLDLDTNLNEGECRYISYDELKLIEQQI